MSVRALTFDEVDSGSRNMPPATMSRHPRFAWQPGDVIGLLWSNVAGIGGLIGGYLGISATDHPNAQLAWMAVAIGMLAVSGVGNAVWLAAGSRAIRRRRHALVLRLTFAVPQPAEGAGPHLWVAAPNMTHYHRSDCLLVKGKQVEAAQVDVHRRAGRRPCGVCD